jgi:DNA invertase Pin-like site-specific DNA recombinase
MSDDRQENSVERQRSQVEPWCQAHGYAIVREYTDLGIAGDEIAKRKEFQRMLRDAQAGAFQGIVCDDKDRFGRFDSIDLGEIVAPLRRKGVWLETAAQGRQDWHSFAGRISESVLQEAKAIEAGAISRRVLTGQLLRAQKCIPNGNPPLYGYRWEPDPERHKRYVPDGRKAEVVRLIFTLYDQGKTLYDIADELYRRGVPSPKGKLRWTRAVIQRLLTNRRYAGDWTWGVHAFGKYHRHSKSGVRVKCHGERACVTNPPEDWLVIPDSHEPLIDRETFERVRARLAGNKVRTTPIRGGGGFVLNRLLVCGHCGSVMRGVTHGGKRQYICGGYLAYGKGYCKRNTVREKPLLDFLVRKLQQTFLDPKNLHKLREEMRAQQDRERAERNLAELRRQAEELARKIDQGTERLATVPADLVPDVAAKVQEWKAKRQALLSDLKRIETESPLERLEDQITLAEGILWRLQDALQNEDAPLLRQLVREMVSRIELRWTYRDTGKITRCQLEAGVVYLRTPQEPLNLSLGASQ